MRIGHIIECDLIDGIFRTWVVLDDGEEIVAYFGDNSIRGLPPPTPNFEFYFAMESGEINTPPAVLFSPPYMSWQDGATNGIISLVDPCIDAFYES